LLGTKPKANKSQKALEQRIALLAERGIGLIGNREVTMAQLMDIIGDLTAEEYHSMVSIAMAKGMAEELCRLGRACAAAREAELRAGE
jgi:hypothetical protein